MIGIIGRKVGMSVLYNAEGKSVPCTLIESGSCTVTQIKTLEKDGYAATQLGYVEKKKKHVTKPLLGHFHRANTTPKYKLIEFRHAPGVNEMPKLGQTIAITDVFQEGDYLDATGVAKGKGFQGVVKRHNFSGVGDRTHGQHNRERAPGSIGGASFPARVFKGMRMAGRTGGQRVKVENLQVIKIIPEKNLIIVNGAIPGAKKSYVVLTK